MSGRAGRTPRAPVLRGLPPIVRPDARVLVLGSMPGGMALAMRQYYANPGNRFWRVAGALLGFDPQLPYADRCARLMDHGIAVWDVFAECRRAGSLDSAVERGSEKANDLAPFLRTHASIRTIGLNGSTAASAFRRMVAPKLEDVIDGYRIVQLPSTSGANAGWSFERLLERWSDVLAGGA